MFDRRSGGLVDSVRRLFRRTEEPLLECDRRIVPQGEALYRFAWKLDYRGGKVVSQYERSGDVIFQTPFGKLRSTDVRRIWVYDLEEHPDNYLLWIDVPPGATPDIVYHCTFDPVSRETKRVSTFGWFNDRACYYVHIDPETEPPTIRDSKSRTP